MPARMAGMKFGLAIFATDLTPDPAEVARMAEERGFESLLFPEHTHIPASRETPYPAGIPLPEEYWRLYDPFAACTAAAAATERLLVGTGLCIVPEHDPIITAKQVASIDRLSGGRFLFGVGAGWNLEEMRDHGTDPSKRFGLMRERVEAMKAIWTEDEPEYHGKLRGLRPDLVVAQAGPGARTRRSSSGATAAPWATACSPTATSGTRTAWATTTSSSPGSRRCAAARARRPGARSA